MGDSPDTVPASSGGGQLVRGLKLFDATTIIIGSMIGSGIFIVSADMARALGSPGLLLVSWLIAAVMTILAALSYGELAAAMPHAGRPVCFSSRSLRADVRFPVRLDTVSCHPDGNDRGCCRRLRQIFRIVCALDLRIQSPRAVALWLPPVEPAPDGHRRTRHSDMGELQWDCGRVRPFRIFSRWQKWADCLCCSSWESCFPLIRLRRKPTLISFFPARSILRCWQYWAERLSALSSLPTHGTM